ncbi:NUDIX domain-containing protein [Sphingomonas sp. JC676]|uniref:NUDIX domain-containing protein n=1 Tax=Sphingomonas sp. JC676 TaxID=2768065 RepID=UPI001658265D|nr:NUDIX domain-containing protein [Sphingomonas sp. JC676]MBC9030826.1 NUDIX domain-containing protein [Sphingomonas sp. JC676]
MSRRSAGLLLYNRREAVLLVLLVHPGGPFWRNKQTGAWQIPKGLIDPDEDPLTAALREASEELGTDLGKRGAGAFPLGEVRQAGGKLVEAFALEAELDAEAIVSNRFEIEWPPRSGRRQSFPEVDAARWFTIGEARAMMLPSQLPLLDRLEDRAPQASPKAADG